MTEAGWQEASGSRAQKVLRKKARKSLRDLGECAMMVTSWPIKAAKVDDFCWSLVVHG